MDSIINKPEKHNPIQEPYIPHPLPRIGQAEE